MDGRTASSLHNLALSSECLLFNQVVLSEPEPGSRRQCTVALSRPEADHVFPRRRSVLLGCLHGTDVAFCVT